MRRGAVARVVFVLVVDSKDVRWDEVSSARKEVLAIGGSLVPIGTDGGHPAGMTNQLRALAIHYTYLLLGYPSTGSEIRNGRPRLWSRRRIYTLRAL